MYVEGETYLLWLPIKDGSLRLTFQIHRESSKDHLVLNGVPDWKRSRLLCSRNFVKSTNCLESLILATPCQSTGLFAKVHIARMKAYWAQRKAHLS